jgi:polysaccharide deacetylase 2 family uncharacterized protein YibQ
VRWERELVRAAKEAAVPAARSLSAIPAFILAPRNRMALLGTLALVLMIAGATWAIWRLAAPPGGAAAVDLAAAPSVAPPEAAVPRHAEEPGEGPGSAADPDDHHLTPPPPPPPEPPSFEAATPVTAGLPPEPPAVTEQPSLATIAPSPVVPPWQANAVPVTLPPGQPVIAIVIDDLGPTRGPTLKAIALPGPLTLAFLPYADDLPNLTGKARAAGHELMIHLPMEPIDLKHNNPGPQALLTTLTLPEVRARLDWALGRFAGYVGVNNHMGSAFSTWEPGLAVVMQDLGEKGLLFLDSRTIGNSAAEAVALSYGVPAAGRDIFLDNQFEDPAAIWSQLRQVEHLALKRGQAIAIGHPHPATLQALAQWLPEVQAKGFVLAPVSALVTGDPAAGHLVQVKGADGDLR